MSEKPGKPSQNESDSHQQEDLERLDELRREAGPPTSESDAFNRSVDSDIRRATLRLVGEESEPTDVYADIGAGNPQQRRFERLRANLAHNLEIIETDGSVYANGDFEIYKLVEGLKAVKGIFDFPGQDIQKSVGHAVAEFKKAGGEKFKRNRSTQIYDSLAMLQQAFRCAVTNPETGSRSEELVEQFTEDLCPSGLWGEPELKDAMLQSIDQAYEVVGLMSSPNWDSIKGFVSKLQIELKKQGLDIYPARGKSPQARRGDERKLANARILAWEDFGNETPENPA